MLKDRIRRCEVFNKDFCYSDKRLQWFFDRYGNGKSIAVTEANARAIRTELGEVAFMDVICALFPRWPAFEDWLLRDAERYPLAYRLHTDCHRYYMNKLRSNTTVGNKYTALLQLRHLVGAATDISGINEAACVFIGQRR